MQNSHAQLPTMCGKQIELDFNYMDSTLSATTINGCVVLESHRDEATDSLHITGEECVEIWLHDVNNLNGNVAYFFTDENGFFQISGLRPGVYDLGFRRPDGTCLRIYDIPCNTGNTEPIIIFTADFEDEKVQLKKAKEKMKTRFKERRKNN